MDSESGATGFLRFFTRWASISWFIHHPVLPSAAGPWRLLLGNLVLPLTPVALYYSAPKSNGVVKRLLLVPTSKMDPQTSLRSLVLQTDALLRIQAQGLPLSYVILSHMAPLLIPAQGKAQCVHHLLLLLRSCKYSPSSNCSLPRKFRLFERKSQNQQVISVCQPEVLNAILSLSFSFSLILRSKV